MPLKPLPEAPATEHEPTAHDLLVELLGRAGLDEKSAVTETNHALQFFKALTASKQERTNKDGQPKPAA